MEGSGQTSPEGECKNVVDGGALLQRIPWKSGQAYGAVINLYVAYIEDKFGKATNVFDGYAGRPSTKDVTHIRRSAEGVGPVVTFKFNTVMKGKKGFLSNKQNKQKFINALADKLV